MCRIAGIISGEKEAPELYEKVKSMCDSMQHGGPDDEGIFISEQGNVAFGHRRLSFLDLTSLGHQPMTDSKAQCYIVFNGEVYNFLELKNELLSKGYQFKSNSDTEVILASYLEWGTLAFARFNGMFAFAIYDIRKQQVFLVRDSAGIKPLYYYNETGTGELIFTSEVKAFLNIDSGWEENPDWKLLLLTFGHIPEPYTTLKNIRSLEKGSYLQYDLSSRSIVKREKFRKLGFSQVKIKTKAEAESAIREKLQAAVDRHLISDAPVGLFLSGGIDSSLLTLLAAGQLKDQLHTLSVTFSEQDFSEREYQQAIIEKVNCKHKNYTVGKSDLENNLDAIIAAYDQPSDDGINSWFISKCAHDNGLKAVLSGLGSDELFGGYPSFHRMEQLYLLKHLPSFALSMARSLPSAPLRRLEWLRIQGPVGLYLTMRGLCTPEQAASLCNISVTDVVRRIGSLKFQPMEDDLQKEEAATWLELNYYMQNQLLKDSDFMSMQHALELRVPFLDQDFVDTVYSIDPKLLYKHKGLPKQLLIDSFKDVLPEKIWNRKKMGFSFPFQTWFGKMGQIKEAVKVTKAGEGLWNGFEQGTIHWSKVWAYYLTLTFSRS
ncbi:asparagine synthase (glutamine-hydrolyzing) [Desertivirga arenae]|uniref:asparagine synthase (glutamine-hydrolyzing) n=1 Tax=Desertivirga arenae TaxID=2810309 RepID=UPI001A976960|nr:asparagine synthase (glutamine-hydrolyzing) [Pedobacter sp. SYSU D00823]